MVDTYTDVVFTNRQPDQVTAAKLNNLRDDLSAAIDSIGGYYTDTWKWTTNTADAALSGQVGINASTWAGATFINVSETDAGGQDKTISMDRVVVSGNLILVKDAADPNNSCEYTITGPGVDMGTWRRYPVSMTQSSGVPPKNNTNTTLTVYVQGASGGGGAGTGDMLKSIYDTNNNGKVDTADSVPWASVTGKPATIGDMTKAVYDTNGNGVVDTADSIAWVSVTGKPATFPPDSTAMLKSVYDINGNGIVDTADAIAWTAVTGKPSTFPPDSTAMLKSVYDTNSNNKVDAAESADTAPWTGITGKPANFTPSSHAATHLDNGSDVVPVVTTLRTGLAPKLSGSAATYLDGTGNYSAVPGAVNPGTWTNLTIGGVWTAPSQAQYRLEVNGAVSTVHFRGAIQAAYSAMGTSPFTVPAGAQPSMTRSLVCAGAQNTGTASDIASYVASIAPSGVCTIFFLGAGPFVWADPAQTQIVYLDGIFYSL